MSSSGSVVERLLLSLEGAPVTDLADTAYEVLADEVGLKRLWVYLADYGEKELVPVRGRLASPAPHPLPMESSQAGEAYMRRRHVLEERPGGPILWVPLHRRSECLGVVGFGADAPAEVFADLAGPVALVLAACIQDSRSCSDTYEIVRGARQMELAATMQWQMLPLGGYSDPEVEVAGRLEPAYDVGGDAFDFAVNDRSIDLAIFDAMGHGLQSTLLSQLAVGAYRFSRRRRDDLRAVAAEMDQAVAIYGGGERFVTAHVCRISLGEGVVRWLNIGHPLPVLIRDDVVEPLGPSDPTLPLGLGGEPTQVHERQLEPGDVVVLYSDGVVEGRSPDGEPFGLDRFTREKMRALAETGELGPAVRHVLQQVTAHVSGPLQDDSTIVALRWKGRS
ncbi:MAG TPA: SpoIIE family protein phosphatase [Actinomycetota bacterium]|nr:SpoIIE family protein phosphatase [Actinomycetota bacterium]